MTNEETDRQKACVAVSRPAEYQTFVRSFLSQICRQSLDVQQNWCGSTDHKEYTGVDPRPLWT